MRFAAIANVQANLPALEAVLADIDSYEKRVERVVSAGDVVGLGPYPNEVMAVLEEREIVSVMGNYDDAVGFDRLSSGVDFPSFDAEEADATAIAWTRGTLTLDHLKLLREFPRDMQVLRGAGGVDVKRDLEEQRVKEYKRTFIMRSLMGGFARGVREFGKKVVVMHGSPRALNEYIREDTANSILAAIARELQADVLVTAHAGQAFQRVHGPLSLVGTPSVAGPHSRLGIAEYAVIDVGEKVEVDFRQVIYDPEPYLYALRGSGLPPGAAGS